MNRSDLIDVLIKETDLNSSDTKKVVNIFFDSIKNALAQDQRVEVRGFGSFTVKRYKGYTGRNPKTGQKTDVQDKKLPFFKAGKELKDKVDC